MNFSDIGLSMESSVCPPTLTFSTYWRDCPGRTRKVNCDELGQYDYEAYATIDDDIVTTEAQTDEDIVSEVKKDTEEGGEEFSEDSIPTVSDAVKAIWVVNFFYESRGGSREIVTKIMGIERNLESVYWASNRKRMKITDYCTRI
jgi:hypothetical protein